MDDATEDLYLQKMEEFIHDENLIVTTNYVSRKLNVNIRDAKVLLKKFITDHRNVNGDKLGAIYTLVGKLVETDSFGVLLSEESELEKTRQLFSTVFTEEIYSVQKTLNLDLQTLNYVDWKLEDKPLLGSYVGKNCVKRVLKTTKKSTVPAIKKEIAKPQVKAVVESKPVVIQEKVVVEKKNSSPKKGITKKPVQSSKGITSFFTKTTEKPKIEPKIESKKVEIKAKSPEKDEEEIMVVDSPPKVAKKRNNKLIDTDNDSDEELNKKQSKINEKKVAIRKKTPKNGNSGKRSRSNEKSSEKSTKRRKRVLELTDSDSDDMFASEKEDSDERDISHDDDDHQPEPIIKPKPSFVARNKSKKQVDKSFVDEEGYIVTKKEWVTVSGSEDEEEVNKEQKNPQIAAKVVETKKKVEAKRKDCGKSKSSKTDEEETKKAVVPVSGAGKGKKNVKKANQPSIMSFFNKK